MMSLDTVQPVKSTYQDEQLEINAMRGEVLVNGSKLVLTRKEFELLALLAANEGEILKREDLMMRIWSYSMEIRTRTLDVHIRRLRAKIGEHGEACIETVFGVGYRFQRYRAPEIRPVYTFAMLSASA